MKTPARKPLKRIRIIHADDLPAELENLRRRAINAKRKKTRLPKEIKKGAGLACQLDKTLVKTFCKLLRRGLPPDGICDYLGIAPSTFWTWKRKGDKWINGNGQPPELRRYGLFVLKCKRAFAAYRLRLVENLHRDHNPYWVQALATLERRDRSSFSRNEPQGGAPETFDGSEKFL